MKIYTRTGDDGTTGLFGGGRVSKASLRVDVYGTIDEANATIGRARVWLQTRMQQESPAKQLDAVLLPIQSDLFTLGAELATPPDKDAKLALKTQLIDDDDCTRLERWIDETESRLPPLQSFVLPGGSAASAELHVARCVVRRAERSLVALSQTETIRAPLVVYLNRLSDLLFVLARRANQLAGVDDVPWIPRP